MTARVLHAYGLEGEVHATACQATGSAACELSVSFAARRNGAAGAAGREEAE
jgi:hypothetical protein